MLPGFTLALSTSERLRRTRWTQSYNHATSMTWISVDIVSPRISCCDEKFLLSSECSRCAFFFFSSFSARKAATTLLQRHMMLMAKSQNACGCVGCAKPQSRRSLIENSDSVTRKQKVLPSCIARTPLHCMSTIFFASFHSLRAEPSQNRGGLRTKHAQTNEQTD